MNWCVSAQYWLKLLSKVVFTCKLRIQEQNNAFLCNHFINNMQNLKLITFSYFDNSFGQFWTDTSQLKKSLHFFFSNVQEGRTHFFGHWSYYFMINHKHISFLALFIKTFQVNHYVMSSIFSLLKTHRKWFKTSYPVNPHRDTFSFMLNVGGI